MKFILDQTKIKEAMTKLGKVMNAKSSIPILSGVLVEAQSECILFTGSDGTESVIQRIPLEEGIASVETVGKAVLSKDCLEVAKKLKGLITFEMVDTNILVSQEKTKLEFSILDAEEYPRVAGELSKNPIILSGQEFFNMVNKTAFAASTSETRPILQGVNMSFNQNGNVFVATDSHRLGKVALGKAAVDQVITIPAKTLEYAAKSFDLDREVFIFPSDIQIAFLNGNTILYSRLLEGVFPDTSRLIPQEYQSNLVVNRKEFLDALDILTIMSKNSVVNLKVSSLFVELSGHGETSNGYKEIAFESYDGDEGFMISFSAVERTSL